MLLSRLLVIITLFVALFFGCFFAEASASCRNGRCRTPLKTTGKVVVRGVVIATPPYRR